MIRTLWSGEHLKPGSPDTTWRTVDIGFNNPPSTFLQTCFNSLVVDWSRQMTGWGCVCVCVCLGVSVGGAVTSIAYDVAPCVSIHWKQVTIGYCKYLVSYPPFTINSCLSVIGGRGCQASLLRMAIGSDEVCCKSVEAQPGRAHTSRRQRHRPSSLHSSPALPVTELCHRTSPAPHFPHRPPPTTPLARRFVRRFLAGRRERVGEP